MTKTIILGGSGNEWLFDEGLQGLFQLLEQDGEEARVAGGAVRNALMGKKITDVDIACTRLPDDSQAVLEAADIKVIPTGIDHGTITAIINGSPIEITTLREDIDTDGRHAVVRFGRNWKRDAERRDLTINALYCDRTGLVHDVLGTGLNDIESGIIRFIGVSADRIEEDYLRILRFFRFFAWYGTGRPDAEGLKACARLKDGIDGLSVERIWKEFKRLLEAPDPSRAILWMRQVGVLDRVLPESAKWGIDLLPSLVTTADALGLAVDPLLRIMAIMRPHDEVAKGLASRLKLSGKEEARLVNWARSLPLDVELSNPQAAKLLYQGDERGIVDASILQLARLREKAVEDNSALHDAAKLSSLIEFALGWVRPEFPIAGKHLIANGMKPGEAMGKELARLEAGWIENGFEPTGEMKKLLA